MWVSNLPSLIWLQRWLEYIRNSASSSCIKGRKIKNSEQIICVCMCIYTCIWSIYIYIYVWITCFQQRKEMDISDQTSRKAASLCHELLSLILIVTLINIKLWWLVTINVCDHIWNPYMMLLGSHIHLPKSFFNWSLFKCKVINI